MAGVISVVLPDGSTRELAEGWLKCDPNLQNPSSAGARKAIRRMLSLGFSLGDVG